MPGPPSRPRVNDPRLLATLTAAQVLSVASATVVAVALPDLARDLGASSTEQQWVVDAFVLVFASLLIAGGVIGDRYGRRNAFLVGLGLFATGSLLCAVAPTVEWLIAGRVMQALGPPLVLPASLAIVAATNPDPAARARAIGLWATGSGLGVVLGPLLGGLIVEGLHWRWVFGFNVPVLCVLAIFALQTVPHDRPDPPGQRFDAPAAVLLTGSVALLVFGLIEGRELGWGSAQVLGVFAASGLLLCGFARHEFRHPAPLVDLRLLRQRSFLAANIAAATLYGALTGLAIYVSVFLQQVQDRSPVETGLCLLPQGLLIMVCAPLAARVTTRIGPRTPILTGLAISAVAFLGLLALEPDTSIAYVWAAFALLGVGTGLALPTTTMVAVAAVGAEQAGMASAIHNASRQLGQTFAVAVLGTIIFAVGGAASESSDLRGVAGTEFVDGLHAALLVTAGALVVATVAVAALVPRREMASSVDAQL